MGAPYVLKFYRKRISKTHPEDSFGVSFILLKFDSLLGALLLWQEIEFDNLAAVVTLGSANNEFNVATWGFYLLGARRRVTTYDSDQPGEKGAAKLRWMHTRTLEILRLRSQVKDLADFHVNRKSLTRSPFHRIACDSPPQVLYG